MIIKNTPFKRVTIIGVGLMGGSLGLALKKRGLAREVVGLAYRQSSLVQAIKNKAIDVAFTDPQKAVRNSDMVILAAPVDSIIKILPTIAPHIKRGCVVTDVGSTKSEIVETGEKVLPVPGLPIRMMSFLSCINLRSIRFRIRVLSFCRDSWWEKSN